MVRSPLSQVKTEQSSLTSFELLQSLGQFDNGSTGSFGDGFEDIACSGKTGLDAGL